MTHPELLQNHVLVNEILGSAAGLCLIAAILFVCRKDFWAWISFGLGTLIAAAMIVVNAFAVGDIPLGNMYQVQVVLGFVFLPLAILVSVRDKSRAHLAWFALAAVLALIGACFQGKEADWRRMPALQSAWFAPHVLAYMIGYALAAVAALMQLGQAITATAYWQLCFPRPTQETNPQSNIIPIIIRLAMPFLLFGLLSGCLWADQAWGHFWSWDPKETWSLITIVFYLIYFHLARLGTAPRWRILCHFLAFAALITTFYVVNMVPRMASAMHSYTK